MPVIDYQRTVIYKFYCLDPRITMGFVASTTNLTKRKAYHKALYKVVYDNPEHPHYTDMVYKTIRENGGWDNWRIRVLELFPCDNVFQQCTRERYWRGQVETENNR